jgi:hypothetical protein
VTVRTIEAAGVLTVLPPVEELYTTEKKKYITGVLVAGQNKHISVVSTLHRKKQFIKKQTVFLAIC